LSPSSAKTMKSCGTTSLQVGKCLNRICGHIFLGNTTEVQSHCEGNVKMKEGIKFLGMLHDQRNQGSIQDFLDGYLKFRNQLYFIPLHATSEMVPIIVQT